MRSLLFLQFVPMFFCLLLSGVGCKFDKADHGSSEDKTSNPYRTIDGSGNNLKHPKMNQAGVQLVRLTHSAYADGISSLAGPNRPNPRQISNIVNHQNQSIPNPNSATNFVWLWGQFIDHDITFSSESREEPANINIPIGDTIFDPGGTGTVQMFFNRAISDTTKGTSADNPRQQVNRISGWIDASSVYGSDIERANALRTNDGSGQLKTSPGNLLPFNDSGLPNARFPDSRFFLAGDERANENIGLISMHTLFVREHNRLARQMAISHPGLSGEEIYQRTRRIVGAYIQAITYNEFLPVILGPDALPPYSHYDDSLSSGIANEFSSAAYRVGHTLLDSTIQLIDAQGNEIEALPLKDTFFKPEKVVEVGIEPILRGFNVRLHQQADVFMIDDIRNFLFVDQQRTGTPQLRGFDLASLNIQRGRDHGLPSYNDMREAFGLERKESFSDITSDLEVEQRLRGAYGVNENGTDKTDDMDVWIAGLAEDRHGQSMLGELFHKIVSHQFRVLRDGDRFWYERTFSQDELREVQETTLADIIRRNTDIENEITGNVFVAE